MHKTRKSRLFEQTSLDSERKVTGLSIAQGLYILFTYHGAGGVGLKILPTIPLSYQTVLISLCSLPIYIQNAILPELKIVMDVTSFQLIQRHSKSQDFRTETNLLRDQRPTDLLILQKGKLSHSQALHTVCHLILIITV